MEHNCILCKKQFICKNSLKLHLNKKQSCVSQKTIIKLYKNLHKLLSFDLDTESNKQLQKLLHDIKKIISIVKLNPIYNTLHNYNNEDTSIIEQNFTNLENANEDSFLLFVKLLYCNPDYPQNRTIKVTSMQGLFCRIYLNEKWIIECYETVMHNITTKFCDIMKKSDSDVFSDYLLFIYEVNKKKCKKSTKIFNTYTKKKILPLLYNQTKLDKKFTYLVSN